MRRNTLRLSGFDYLGRHLYFLTYCTAQRKPIFTCASHVEIVHSQILRAASAESVHVSAYCYMPDHLHLLVAGQSPDSDGKAFIAKSKQLSGYAFRRETREQLWQRYAYDRLVSPYTVHDVVRYILANPVVAGIVRLPLEYPYSGSEVWSRAELGRLMEGYPKPAAPDRAGTSEGGSGLP